MPSQPISVDIDRLEKYNKDNPKDINGYISLGFTYILSKKYKQSLKIFKKALKLDNTNSNIYRGIGEALRRLKKNKEAIPYLKKVTELENKNANAYYSYGGCLLSIGMYEEGVEQIRIASELDDKYWSRYNNVKNAVGVIIEFSKRKKN